MKLTALLALVVVLLPSPCRSQTPDQQAQIVMQQAVEAMGGEEAIDRVTNLSVRAVCTGERGGQFTVEVQSILPDRTFFRETVLSQVTEFTLVGDVAWRRGPGPDSLALVKEPHVRSLLRQREIHLMLADLVDRFTTHKVLGTEIRGGAQCSLMEMQDQWGQLGSVCFDQKTFLPMEVRFYRPPAAGGEHVTITLDEWTQVGEVLFPLALTRVEGVETFSMRYESIELGVVEPDLFQIPGEIQEQLEADSR